MEVATLLNIESHIYKKPNELSGRQCQRVGLRRAMVRKPSLFLMDEPLSNLDAQLRVQMRLAITKLHRKLQSTIIYVTHDQIEALTMATRIVVMKDGEIQQIGKPKEVYDKPKNLFVAHFIGSPSMNFITATIENNLLRINHLLYVVELRRTVFCSF